MLYLFSLPLIFYQVLPHCCMLQLQLLVLQKVICKLGEWGAIAHPNNISGSPVQERAYNKL